MKLPVALVQGRAKSLDQVQPHSGDQEWTLEFKNSTGDPDRQPGVRGTVLKAPGDLYLRNGVQSSLRNSEISVYPLPLPSTLVKNLTCLC